MATNPELEAAIEKAPDDADAYHVYGDWLQTQGDPRGELIALQAAAMRDPDDKKASARADKFFREHAEELLGELHEMPAKSLALGWYMGFVRDVRIKLPFSAMHRTLATLLAHPSGRFVQSISIADFVGVEASEVVALLVALGKPTTLVDLRVGRAWDTERDGEQLHEVFPRFQRSLQSEWKRIEKVLAEQRRLDVKYDVAQLPPLTPREEGIGLDHARLLVGLKLEIEKGRELGIVQAMKRSFTGESLDRFAVALGEQFEDSTQQSSMRWGFQAIGAFGDTLAASWIANHIARWSHPRAAQGIEMLGRIGSGLAHHELYAVASDPRMLPGRRGHAQTELDAAAKARNLDIDTLLDRAKVGPTREVRLREAATRRLRDHMVDGRRFKDRDFASAVVHHPIVGPLARGLVWATYEAHQVETTFVLDDDGVAIGVDGTPIDLAGAVIGIVHPAELDDERLLAAWRTQIELPLFEQLDRPVMTLRESEDGPVLTRFKLRTVGFDRLREGFEGEVDWTAQQEDYDSGSITDGWEKYFRRDNATAVARIVDGAIGTVTLARNGKPLAWTKAHPVTISEVLLTVERATTREKAIVADEVESAAGTITKGMRVRITSGPGRLQEGVVFWLGEGRDGPRLGVRNDRDGEALWVDASDVRPIGDAPPAPTGGAVKRRRGDAAPVDVTPAKKPPKRKAEDSPVDPPPSGTLAFAKGSRVSWNKGRHSGTGAVFWIGPNKFGDGMRVGVKDDETGETVWADAADCTPTT